MNTQDVLVVHPKTTEQLKALKAFMKALKIKFEINKSEESPYNPDFVAKMEESIQQVNEGKTVKIELDDIWKE